MEDPSPKQELPSDAIVYVDPGERTILGPVVWEKEGIPKPSPRPPREGKEKPRKSAWYPYCTLRSAQHLYKKQQAGPASPLSLDEAIERAQREPFWN